MKLLQTHGADAKLVAGGQSLLTMMKLRLVTPAHLIDLGRIASLRHIRLRDGHLKIGALATHWMIESSALVRRTAPALADTAATIGDVQVRNLGTIGGSLVHGDPAGDYPATMLALEAEFTLAALDGERTVPAAQFFQGVMTTAAREDEIMTEVSVPVPPARFGAAYVKMANPASGFALAGAAAALRLDETGRCAHVRVGVTGVAGAAYRALHVEEALAGREPTDELIAQAAGGASDGVEANDDIHAGADYRLHLARVLTRRALALARERAHTVRRRRAQAN